nr:MAG TPA: hypothetical protein [Caudoviricetes sp.]
MPEGRTRPPLVIDVIQAGALCYLTRGDAASSSSHSGPCRWWLPNTSAYSPPVYE